MDPAIEAELSLIILEHHAGWPACAPEYERAFPCSLIEVQAEREPPTEFALRVGRRARSIVAKGSRIRVAIVATNGSLDALTRHSRRQLAHVVAHAIGLSGELVLSAVPDTHTLGPLGVERLRCELLAIAGLLRTQLAGTEIIVSVQFTDAKRKSGTHPRVRTLREPSQGPQAAWSSAARTGAPATLDSPKGATRQS